MSDTTFFNSTSCPRCKHETLFRLGDAHFITTPLMHNSASGEEKTADLECYAKVCRNCAYVELYSRFLIDEFARAFEAAESFGRITEAPGGQYLISIFRTYKHHNTIAKDFTVILDASQWFELRTTLERLTDEEIVTAVLYGPYRNAWRERIGKIPADMGKNLRLLIQTYATPDK